MGIPKDKRHLVFQKFGQVAAKKSGGVRSTGIGLTFCKLAIEAHGCEIDFDSDADNSATFWFSLHKDQDIENVQIVETKIPKTITGIELHDEEKAYLLQFTNELKKCEIYEITVLLNIIEQIEDKSEQIKLWKNDLIKIINNFDEDGYKKQLNINR